MKVKRIAVLAASLAFAASVFCLPAAAESGEVFSLADVNLTGFISGSGSTSYVTVSLGVPYPSSTQRTGYDYSVSISRSYTSFSLELNRKDGKPFLILEPGYEYTFYNRQWVRNSVPPYDVSIRFISIDGSYYLTSAGSGLVITSDDISNVSTIRVTYFWSSSQSSGISGYQEDFYFTSTDTSMDALIDGDGTPLAPDYNEDLNNSTDELTDLENDALGGKTDEEISAEVDEALDFDMNSLDSNASFAMAGLFDDLLDVFGADYQALLLLALSLGLAAFIIGRRYKA